MEIKAANRRFRVSLFDIVIVLLVIALGLGLLFVRGHRSGGADAMEQVYQIEISNLKEGSENVIQPGDRLIDKVKKLDLGDVVSVEYQPFKVTSEDWENQQIVETEVPGRQTAIVTVQASCVDDGTKITTTSGYDLAVGTSVSLVGPGYSGAGYIISMDRSDD